MVHQPLQDVSKRKFHVPRPQGPSKHFLSCGRRLQCNTTMVRIPRRGEKYQKKNPILGEWCEDDDVLGNMVLKDDCSMIQFVPTYKEQGGEKAPEEKTRNVQKNRMHRCMEQSKIHLELVWLVWCTGPIHST